MITILISNGGIWVGIMLLILLVVGVVSEYVYKDHDHCDECNKYRKTFRTEHLPFKGEKLCQECGDKNINLMLDKGDDKI